MGGAARSQLKVGDVARQQILVNIRMMDQSSGSFSFDTVILDEGLFISQHDVYTVLNTSKEDEPQTGYVSLPLLHSVTMVTTPPDITLRAYAQRCVLSVANVVMIGSVHVKH